MNWWTHSLQGNKIYILRTENRSAGAKIPFDSVCQMEFHPMIVVVYSKCWECHHWWLVHWHQAIPLNWQVLGWSPKIVAINSTLNQNSWNANTQSSFSSYLESVVFYLNVLPFVKIKKATSDRSNCKLVTKLPRPVVNLTYYPVLFEYIRHT